MLGLPVDIKQEFISLIRKNEGIIFKITLLYSDSTQSREDLHQEIIYQLWKSYGSFRKDSKFSTWMYRVALNTAIYHLKQKKRTVTTIPLEVINQKFPEEIDKVEEERIKMLYESIQLLNLLEKGIILLYLEGKSHIEISSIIGISTSNVGTKISRIKEKLKAQVNKNNTDGIRRNEISLGKLK